MSTLYKTLCCDHEYFGINHSPVLETGYCLHCGHHPEINELKNQLKEALSIIKELKESNETCFNLSRQSLAYLKHVGWDDYHMDTEEFQCCDNLADSLFQSIETKQSTDQRIEKLKKEVRP